MTCGAVLLACASLSCLFCRFGLLPESDGFVTIYRERGDGSINGSINEGSGTIKSDYIDGLTVNEQHIMEIVSRNPGCKREEIAAKMSCSERTACRGVANLIAGNMLEYRGSKKTGGYYLIEKV